MGCGSSKVAASTITVQPAPNGSIKKENIDTSSRNGKDTIRSHADKKNEIAKPLSSSLSVDNMESYSPRTKSTSAVMDNFARRKRNLIKSSKIFEEVDERSKSVRF